MNTQTLQNVLGINPVMAISFSEFQKLAIEWPYRIYGGRERHYTPFIKATDIDRKYNFACSERNTDTYSPDNKKYLLKNQQQLNNFYSEAYNNYLAQIKDINNRAFTVSE